MVGLKFKSRQCSPRALHLNQYATGASKNYDYWARKFPSHKDTLHVFHFLSLELVITDMQMFIAPVISSTILHHNNLTNTQLFPVPNLEMVYKIHVEIRVPYPLSSLNLFPYLQPFLGQASQSLGTCSFTMTVTVSWADGSGCPGWNASQQQHWKWMGLPPTIPKCLPGKSKSLRFYMKAAEASHQIQRQVGDAEAAVESQCLEN